MQFHLARVSVVMLVVNKRIHVASIANALFVISLVLPASVWDDYPTDRFLFGFEILLKGWAGPLTGDFAWYANPIFLYVSCSLWRRKNIRARRFWAALLVVAATSVLVPGLHAYSWLLSQSQVVLVGAYVWGCSMLLAAIAAIALPRIPSRPTPRHGEA